ncbi:hypothetical protein FISHEDRAFT_61237 [Fistulina hepatica ATCC 64428]|uniref:Formamidopyrimidine-DNA glycosylase catalytic domain-containing protein n=1 Tax=Fistulina hepatica ATCC 64428 TaxID=1128425 RepID=A0A0D7A5N1_9AGAR|nr:hypothetical protein FISHEDRAFT_61237 [Fistulina hepatica ATCC 64428]
MPELPEVQRAVDIVNRVGAGKQISDIQTFEDSIVFAGVTHLDFASEVKGRTFRKAHRYGKVFYLELEGKGRMPVLHFGMTGMIQIKGESAVYYREGPKDTSTDVWPPRYVKFILHLTDPISDSVCELAFLDARRLAHIRLCASPMTEPPISELGFDPLLSMPRPEDFVPLVRKRSCPIKALLLDQSFSAGVGNWVADEILYHSRIHPEQRCHTLSDAQLEALYFNIVNVCQIAVSVDANHELFPDDFLFKHRWGKGKKAKPTLKLPSGELATIKWITVGGRTSAYIEELQLLPSPALQEDTNPETSVRI